MARGRRRMFVVDDAMARQEAAIGGCPSADSGATILGESAEIRALLGIIDQIAPTQAHVLITGESGSGKELVAREIHRRSRRAHHPFVAVNCAALPLHLLESELFGHLRGAFTDARKGRDGLFVQAGAGSIFP